ncbi:TonB-dependent siderophore receptor [Pseudomonas argentinensis]|uniref:Outer-membrane receptor for ferric coprogen and ferric-rhodotorulic acid n=1 Tax=Phytopseudomonas argentinensis TaxID=289370 RepID=A0A1I3JT77_9GAMM|nr:TonB-dependent siderophore receptor [Pseudomonas argentinensis]KAB0551017.1 TonB-dependent siderophore receptor [Pseudomonas argentinensis]SFI63394.1 outer-membrane receptor for ferric coprogen and ferric-rhodotorulic acid [Pseudomonas argentinensis]
MSRLTPPRCLAAPRNHLALAICMATMTPALAQQGEAHQSAAGNVLELGATEITNTQLGSTTEGSRSYTTGAMSTATKLPMTMRETPQAVTVITRQRMDDMGMTSINDAIDATPGVFLSYASGPGRQTYYARGFEIDNLMYDGIPSGYNGVNVGVQPNLAMFDRVEIVRGATGLVTGAGNPSAAVNMVRKRPLGDQRVTLTGAAGSWDDYRGEVDASSPLNESGTLRGRVVTSYRDANSYIDGAEEDHGLLYAITEADLSDDTTLAVGFSHQKDKTNNFWGASLVGLDGRHQDLPRSYNPGTDWENKEQETNTLFAELRHQLANDWKLQFNGSYAKQNALFSGSYQSRFKADRRLERTVYQTKNDERQTGLDAFASGPFQAFGRTHELVIGASKRIYDMTSDDYDPYNFSSWPVDGGKPDFTRISSSRAVTSQDGVYMTTRLSLADPLKLILGGRLDWYDYDDKESSEADYKVTRNVTRYAGLIYDLDDHHSVYVSYSDIFTPQSNKDTSGSPIKPIVGKNYEVGIKGEYFDGALNASAALFRIDQENRAVNVTGADRLNCSDQQNCSVASGEVRSQGIDLELQGALTENWQLGAGYTYARVHTLKDAANPQNENQRFDTDMPEHLFKLSTVYRFQGPLEKLRVGGNLSWQSRMYNDIPLDGGSSYRLKQGAYALTSLMAGYAVNENLDLQLNANNVFDKKYYSSISTSTQYGGDTYGAPRNLMLTAKYSF